MSIFLSYSHQDVDTVNRIAIALARENIAVWKDSWRIRAGDKLSAGIREAIERTPVFCVAVSEHSLQSNWVRTEVDLALELERSGRLVLVPLRIDDAAWPESLRERLGIDFAADFDEAIGKLSALVQQIGAQQETGRIKGGGGSFIDWAVHTFEDTLFYRAEIDVVSFDDELEYTIVTRIQFLGAAEVNPEDFGASNRNDLTRALLSSCARSFRESPARIALAHAPVESSFSLENSSNTSVVTVVVRVKRLGAVRSPVVLFNVGALFEQISGHFMRATALPATMRHNSGMNDDVSSLR